MSENTDEAKKVHDAAEKPGNQVAAATNDGKDHHDPYAMGKKINHPDNDLSEKPSGERDESDQEADDKSADLAADQEERDAKAATPDANLPDGDKTAPANKPDEGAEGAKSKSQERREAASK